MVVFVLDLEGNLFHLLEFFRDRLQIVGRGVRNADVTRIGMVRRAVVVQARLLFEGMEMGILKEIVDVSVLRQ